MKSFRITLVMVAIIAFSIVACSDDDSPTDTGTPDDTSAGNVCNEGICSTNDAEKARCEEFLSNCLQVEDEDECIGGAWLICEGV